MECFSNVSYKSTKKIKKCPKAVYKNASTCVVKSENQRFTIHCIKHMNCKEEKDNIS